MSNFSKNDHRLSYSVGFGELIVKNLSDIEVESFDLATPHSVQIVSGNYCILAITTIPDGNVKCFGTEERDEAYFTVEDHLGVSDLRTECRLQTTTYHLTACPIVVWCEDGKLNVQAPCPASGGCENPSGGCCDISYEDYDPKA